MRADTTVSTEKLGIRTPPGAWGVVDTLLLAGALGLLFGLGEVAGIGWRALVRGLLTHVTPHVTWMAPVAYAVLFLALAPIAVLVGRLAGRRGPGIAVFLYVFLGVFGWLEMLPWSLHWVAVLLLSLALAGRLAVWANARPAVWKRGARLGLPALAVVVAIVGGVVLRAVGAENEATSFAGPNADVTNQAQGPNVLLLILDTVRSKSLGLYGGSPEVSPQIDALAGEAVTFDRAISTAPWTLPSHASMFTGRWPHELSVGWSDPLDDAEPTLAEVLSRAGYSTAGFVANLAYGARLWGLARGFQHYDDFPVSAGQVVLATSLGRTIATNDRLRGWLGNHELLNRKTAAHLKHDLFDWLDRREGGSSAPFFAFINFYDAHEPYEPPPSYRERFAPGFERDDMEHRHNLLRGINARRGERWTLTEEEIAGELALYEAAIASLDAEIGEILAGLDERGILESTVVILTSDHGEQMGEHGMFDHMQSLYQPLTHVPLLIRLPGGAPAGLRVATPVSLVDLSATILDLTGVDEPGWPGASLAAAWSPDPGPAGASPAFSQLHRGLVEQPWYPIARGLEMQALVDGRHHYICNPDASEELYDLRSDPEETRNLITEPDLAERVLELRRLAAPMGAPPQWCPPAATEAPRAPEPRR